MQTAPFQGQDLTAYRWLGSAYAEYNRIRPMAQTSTCFCLVFIVGVTMRWKITSRRERARLSSIRRSAAPVRRRCHCSGEQPLTILPDKQGKHIWGHKNYTEGRSDLTIT